MERLGFLGKDRLKLTIEALYNKCDLILVPTEQLINWMFVDGDVNSELQKHFEKRQKVLSGKLNQFNCIGIHRKLSNEFLIRNNNVTSIWCLTSIGSTYELIFTAQKIQKGSNSFYNIKLDKRLLANYSRVSGFADAPTLFEIDISVSLFYSAIISYYAINPYIFYVDSRTHGYGGKGNIRTYKEPDKKVIILTINHHKYKIHNGINVLDTYTGRIFPSIAEASRKLEYPYSMLWQLLKDDTIPPLKRIEKLHLKS